jgi:lysozyme family protein
MKRYILLFVFIFQFFAVSASSFDKYFPRLIAMEGVLFTVTQYDKGGATKYGITYDTFKLWCDGRMIEIAPCDKDNDRKVTVNDLRLTVLQDVKPIYEVYYWNKVRASEFRSQALAELFTDLTINSGMGWKNCHIKALQKIVGVVADGRIGNNTLKSINRGYQRGIYEALYKYRKNFYFKISRKKHQKKFLRGWLFRISKLKQIHLHENLI